MTEHPALRRALRTFAADVATPLDLSTAAVRRARRIRRRRTALTYAGAVASVVAVVTVSTLPSTSRLVGTAGDPPVPSLPVSTSLLPTLPSLSSSPSPKPTKSPPPTSSPSPTDSPSDSPTATPHDNKPLQVRVTTDTKHTETATFVNFTVTAHRPAGMVVRMVVAYGDGRGYDDWSWATADYCPTSSPDDQTDFTFTLEHAYRAAGTYDMTVTMTQMTSCTTSGDSSSDGVHVDVAQGAVLSNGPTVPTVGGKFIKGSTKSGDGVLTPYTWTVKGKLSGWDDDGWVTKITVDWGDGSTPTGYDFGTDGCTDTPTAWPQSQRYQSVEHAYTKQGTYSVTYSVTSTGCDGTDAQDFSRQAQVIA